MKELFESAFDIGKQSVEYASVDFYHWWELHKDNIDSAIEKYLEEQGKHIVTQEQMDTWVNEVKSANQMIVKITKLIQSS